MNLITHFVLYLGKEKTYDIETLSRISRMFKYCTGTFKLKMLDGIFKALSLKNKASRYVIFNKSTMLRKTESTILLLSTFETKKVKLYLNLGLLFLQQ